MLGDAARADALGVAQRREGARQALGDVERLGVGHDDVVGHARAARGVAAPGAQGVVTGLGGFVGGFELVAEGFAARLKLLRVGLLRVG